MFKSFEELLEKTQGYPDDRKTDLKNTAETLETIGLLSQSDLQKEVQEIIENLPEVRKQRAQAMRESAKELPKDERAACLKNADRLTDSAEKLRAPTVNEQFKNRAVLTELSLRLKQKIRSFDKMMPELDPERLERYQKAIHTAEKAMPADLSADDRSLAARFAFASELMAAGGPKHFDLAVDNFYKAVRPTEYERGHKGDVELTPVAENALDQEQHTQDYLTQRLQEQDQAERMDRVKHNKVLINMPILAAEYLKPQEYAAYRVMIENEHLIDWKLENGQVVMKAKTLDAGDPENTIGKILQKELGYQHVRGANMVIKQTVDKMNGLLHEHGKADLTPSQKAAERMQQRTREVLDAPESQSRLRKKGLSL